MWLADHAAVTAAARGSASSYTTQWLPAGKISICFSLVTRSKNWRVWSHGTTVSSSAPKRKTGMVSRWAWSTGSWCRRCHTVSIEIGVVSA